MDWFILLLGYFWILLGVMTIFFAREARKYYGIFIEGNHPKSMGALALLVGGLLVSSGAGRNFYILIFILGLIQVIKGLFLLFGRPADVRRLINWWVNTNLIIYRLWGLITLIMGLILIRAV